ncbi:hypothetical protein B0H13DRAFT_1850960 [Mycena leptocephala]|nr:hypothetical protein B0H13DRAFT_1850960 [Mycena leptocephala]
MASAILNETVSSDFLLLALSLMQELGSFSFLTEAVRYFGWADSIASGIPATHCVLFGIPTKRDILWSTIYLGLNSRCALGLNGDPNKVLTHTITGSEFAQHWTVFGHFEHQQINKSPCRPALFHLLDGQKAEKVLDLPEARSGTLEKVKKDEKSAKRWTKGDSKGA